jgi:SAM-dependent methyltransferase
MTENFAEYEDPEIYDLENHEFNPDGPFFLDYALKLGGAVLELGCGTGRVTIPMAEKGVDITGLDVTPAMIARAKQKAGALPIRWVTADARSFELERQFRLIFETGSVFMHILTRPGQEAFLARVHSHLEDGGRFITRLLFPHPPLMAAVDTEKEWFSYENHTGQQVRVSGTEYYDEIQQVKLETAYRRWVDETGQEVLRVAPLYLRYIFPQEMEALLHYNGFEVLERFGGWDLSPLTGESQQMIYICQNRTDTRRSEYA